MSVTKNSRGLKALSMLKWYNRLRHKNPALFQIPRKKYLQKLHVNFYLVLIFANPDDEL